MDTCCNDLSITYTRLPYRKMFGPTSNSVPITRLVRPLGYFCSTLAYVMTVIIINQEHHTTRGCTVVNERYILEFCYLIEFCFLNSESVHREQFDIMATATQKLPTKPNGKFSHQHINSSDPGQNGRHFPDDIFKCILLKFVPKRLIDNTSASVRVMAWHRTGDKPLSEPMMVSLLTQICVTGWPH